MFGMKSIMGWGGANVLTGLLMIAARVVCGLLVRLPFMAALSNTVEGQNDSLFNSVDQQHEYSCPAYLVEEDQNGSSVMLLPEIPDTSRGHTLLVARGSIKLVPSVTADRLDASPTEDRKGIVDGV
jgi:hypothetical protein